MRGFCRGCSVLMSQSRSYLDHCMYSYQDIRASIENYLEVKSSYFSVYGDEVNLTSCRQKESVLQVYPKSCFHWLTFFGVTHPNLQFPCPRKQRASDLVNIQVENNQFINLTTETIYSGCRWTLNHAISNSGLGTICNIKSVFELPMVQLLLNKS